MVLSIFHRMEIEDNSRAVEITNNCLNKLIVYFIHFLKLSSQSYFIWAYILCYILSNNQIFSLIIWNTSITLTKVVKLQYLITFASIYSTSQAHILIASCSWSHHQLCQQLWFWTTITDLRIRTKCLTG